jgi:hypothetical protein
MRPSNHWCAACRQNGRRRAINSILKGSGLELLPRPLDIGDGQAQPCQRGFKLAQRPVPLLKFVNADLRGGEPLEDGFQGEAAAALTPAYATGREARHNYERWLGLEQPLGAGGQQPHSRLASHWPSVTAPGGRRELFGRHTSQPNRVPVRQCERRRRQSRPIDAVRG